MTLKEMRVSMGMTQIEFASLFSIPRRTLQSWESGERKPPEYIIKLIEQNLMLCERITRLEKEIEELKVSDKNENER